MNPRICLLVFNDFIKPAIFQQIMECLVSMAKRKKLKSGLCIVCKIAPIKLNLFQKAKVMLKEYIV